MLGICRNTRSQWSSRRMGSIIYFSLSSTVHRIMCSCPPYQARNGAFAGQGRMERNVVTRRPTRCLAGRVDASLPAKRTKSWRGRSAILEREVLDSWGRTQVPPNNDDFLCLNVLKVARAVCWLAMDDTCTEMALVDAQLCRPAAQPSEGSISGLGEEGGRSCLAAER